MENVTHLLNGGVYVAIIFFFMFVVKLIDDKRTLFDDDDLVAKGNTAVGFRRGGFYLAVAVAMSAALTGASRGLGSDVFNLLWEGGLIVVLLFASRAINDRLILSNVDNDNEVGKGNTAIGIVEFGCLLATALILNGAFSGEADAGGVLAAIVFFVLGQAVLASVYLLFYLVQGVSLKSEVAKGNLAAAVSFASIMVGMGLILRASVSGAFVSWQADLLSFAICAFGGEALLGIFSKLADWLLLPKTEYKQDVTTGNVASLLIYAGATVGVATVIAYSL